jgi:poly(3-hydroxybutyrate) depolymerase
MKSFYLPFSIIIFLYQVVYTQVTSKTLFGVSYKNGNTWIAVGEDGTITGTNTKWSDTWFQGVSFSDANNGFAVGWQGVIFRTTDGGDTWVELTSGTNHLFYEVSSTDENTATAVGSGGTIRRTTNGGQTWFVQSSTAQGHLYGVSFTDFNNGTIVGAHGIIYRTLNGGVSWFSQLSGTTAWLYGVSFTDSSTGTAVGWNGTIIRTTDAGTTWTTQNSGTMQWLNGVCFVNSNVGTAVGCGGTILRTIDGGANWIPQSSGITSVLFSVSFTDANYGVAVGEGGTILTTTNGGENWVVQSGSSQVESHNFIHNGINRNYFVFLPQNYTEGGDYPVVINLHGSTHYSLEYMYLTHMNPVADTAGFIAVYPNSVAGDWNDYNTPPPDDLGFIEDLIDTLATKYSVDLKRIYISGFSNGARMSNLLGCELSDKIAAIAPVAGGILVGCNPSSAVPVVYQHGTNDLNVPYSEGLAALNFWIQNNAATAYTDTMQLPDIDPNDGSTVTKFIYRNSSGEVKVVFYRINSGGHQWSGSPLTLPNNSLKNRDINSSAEIWNFVKDLVVGISENTNSNPTNFSLSQNYPNPFNPKTVIGYQLPVSSNVTLKVYDLLGREVATLVDEYKPAGSYNATFYAGSLSSGVYLYKLTAGDFIQTKKLILMK